MSLTEAQFARAALAEESRLRMMRLERMSGRELRALFRGDLSQAAPFIRSAAEHGLRTAQLCLGRMLLAGTGVPRDERGASSWFSRAAEQGDPEAMNMLGRCHENGWGVPVDLRRAATCYWSSAQSGHDWGEYNFGNLLFDGRGVARDLGQAFHWFARAALQGHARAMNLLGRCLEEGWGCRRSLADAVDWYRRSAAAGYFRGQFNYALALAEQGSSEAAAEWFWKAASGGNDDIGHLILRTLAGTRDPALARVAGRIALSRRVTAPCEP